MKFRLRETCPIRGCSWVGRAYDPNCRCSTTKKVERELLEHLVIVHRTRGDDLPRQRMVVS